MYVSINIEQMAQPVLSNAVRISLIPRFLHFLINRSLNKFSDELDIFILSLEGSLNHLEHLTLVNATNLLGEIKKIILKFDGIGEELQEVNYFENNHLKEKYLYLQKLLYKVESRLHHIVYKNEKRLKTDHSLKEGVIKMNSLHTKKLLTN
jgi:hypothetical protein